MSFHAIAWACDRRGLSMGERLTLIALANYADRDARAWPFVGTLALDWEMSESTVKRALTGLENKGLIVKDAQWRDDGSRTHNVYLLQMDQRPNGPFGGPSDRPSTPSEGGGFNLNPPQVNSSDGAEGGSKLTGGWVQSEGGGWVQIEPLIKE